LKSGQIDKAIAQSRMTLRYDPSDEVALYHLVQGLRRIKDPQGEIPALTKRLAAARKRQNRRKLPEASIGCMKNRYKPDDIQPK